MMEQHILLGLMAFTALTVLISAWALRQARRSIDNLQHDVDELKKRPV